MAMTSSGTSSEFRTVIDVPEYLTAGQRTVSPMVWIVAPDDLARTTGRAEVVIIDRSSSMSLGRKMTVAKQAACAAVECLEEGVAFAVVAGNADAEQIWPQEPGSLATSSPAERAAACRAIAEIRHDGMTAMGRWLDLARRLLEPADAGLRHVILLSDGWDTHETPEELRAATEACRRVFSCDCRGVGTDWKPEDLRYIADTLHGQEGMDANIDDLAGRDQLVEAFRSLITTSQAKAAPDLRLRIVTRDRSDVGTVLQSAPRTAGPGAKAVFKLAELTDRTEVVVDGQRATELALGAWGPGEGRSYAIELVIRPGEDEPVGERKRLAMIQLVRGDGRVATSGVVDACWTNDPAQVTRTASGADRLRNHYDLSALVQAGRAAWEHGDEAMAKDLLGEADRLARQLRDHDQLERLAKLVRVDPVTGEVELLPASKADRMEADTYSTSMPAIPPPDDEDDSSDED
jgi:hypothetical protein